MSAEHDFESKIVGYRRAPEPQWVQDIVRCYEHSIWEYTCKNCGKSFRMESGQMSLLLLMLDTELECPGVK
jgi:DNA-directed RNA polymerase subunit RPC12/RpoP